MKKSCEMCKDEERSFLNYKKRIFIGIIGLKQKSFCHKHLIEQFSLAFCSYSSKMIVFPPYILKSEHLSYSYQFYPLASSKHLPSYTSIKNALNLISGKCQVCSHDANVAFYDKKHIEWKGELAEIGAIESASPQIVCNICATNLITPYLKESVDGFGMGLDVPFGGEGYYMLRNW